MFGLFKPKPYVYHGPTPEERARQEKADAMHLRHRQHHLQLVSRTGGGIVGVCMAQECRFTVGLGGSPRTADCIKAMRAHWEEVDKEFEP